MLPTVSTDPAVQAAYEEARGNGCAHTLAEMLAFQSPPGSRTDREFLLDSANGKQFEAEPHTGDRYRQEAARAGVSVTGKKYLTGLARYPGDPEAWVSDRGDVRRVCEDRGWHCEGAVTVKGADPVATEQQSAEEMTRAHPGH